MSFFFIYDAENAEYLVQPAGYFLLTVILILLLLAASMLGRRQKHQRMDTKKLVFCAMAIALATVTSFIRIVSLPFGGSITLFSMLFVCLIGYFYGVRTGIITGAAYGMLQLITEPYIFVPVQVLLDYPLAFGALGLSGLFHNRSHGLVIGYIAGVTGRYICHVISGYVFFAEYAPEGLNPLLYTLLYNLTYILPEMLVTVAVLSIPAVSGAIARVKRQSV